MQLRHVRPSDCDRVLAVIDEWWGGPATSSHLPHVFFSHLAPTSFVLEANDGELIGFLLGFLSQARPDEACVHMIGVHPAFRRLGFGRRLCERFFLTAQMHGRRWVRSVSTSSGPSIAFHRALGFVPLHGDAVIDGLPVRRDSRRTRRPACRLPPRRRPRRAGGGGRSRARRGGCRDGS